MNSHSVGNILLKEYYKIKRRAAPNNYYPVLFRNAFCHLSGFVCMRVPCYNRGVYVPQQPVLYLFLLPLSMNVYLTYSNSLSPHKILRRIWENSQHSLAYIPVLIFVFEGESMHWLYSSYPVMSVFFFFGSVSVGNLHTVPNAGKILATAGKFCCFSPACVADVQPRSLADQIVRVAIEFWETPPVSDCAWKSELPVWTLVIWFTDGRPVFLNPFDPCGADGATWYSMSFSLKHGFAFRLFSADTGRQFDMFTR